LKRRGPSTAEIGNGKSPSASRHCLPRRSSTRARLTRSLRPSTCPGGSDLLVLRPSRRSGCRP
jgi:hypothetical protein